ncbi:MAG: sigma-70 family RNA polymerase sigma factor [Clostridia bacterium]|nr:sigma-70 family RNA polymerase sigma factor [Clostridia bacterium]
MDEREIVLLIKQRDERGMSELMRVYGALIRYVISPILADAREREECFADVTMRVWEKIELFEPENGSFKAWLSATTRNTALNRARRNRRAAEDEELTETEIAREETPEEALLRRERISALKAALGSLPAGEQAIFYRKYYYMQSTAQIAAELGTTEKAVEARLYRLKKKLRKMLGGELDG